jgi:hypothetical protein
MELETFNCQPMSRGGFEPLSAIPATRVAGTQPHDNLAGRRFVPLPSSGLNTFRPHNYQTTKPTYDSTTICLFGIKLKNRRDLIFLIFQPSGEGYLVRGDISCEATSSRHRTYWGHESPMQSPSHTLAPYCVCCSAGVLGTRVPNAAADTLPIQKFGIFVPNIFLKSRRITLGTCAERVESIIENR